MQVPEFGELRFNCPHCGAFSNQRWMCAGARLISAGQPAKEFHFGRRAALGVTLEQSKNEEFRRLLTQCVSRAKNGEAFIYAPGSGLGVTYDQEVGNVAFARCESCWDVSVWIGSALVWPVQSNAPLPNQDLPDDVKADYLEAGRIVAESPRGAAALLRLAIQKLCNAATNAQQDIAASIRQLEDQGLSHRVVDALEIVRVVGNESVHPGTLDVRDDPAVAHSLFDLVNRIADALISQGKRDGELWQKLPEEKRKAIEARRAAKSDRGSA